MKVEAIASRRTLAVLIHFEHFQGISHGTLSSSPAVWSAPYPRRKKRRDDDGALPLCTASRHILDQAEGLRFVGLSTERAPRVGHEQVILLGWGGLLDRVSSVSLHFDSPWIQPGRLFSSKL